MIKGTIYNFYPVETEDGSDECKNCDTWHWRYFGWWFEVYTFLRGVMADIIGIEDMPFVIKVKDK